MWSRIAAGTGEACGYFALCPKLSVLAFRHVRGLNLVPDVNTLFAFELRLLEIKESSQYTVFVAGG